jgi:hypothetical protein
MRHVCNYEALVPEKFTDLVLSQAPEGEYSASDVEQTVRCTLEEHAVPVHYGLVLELNEPKAGAVWAVWDSTDGHFSLQVSADCLAQPVNGSEICTEFFQHPGGHTWELTDDPSYRRIPS